MLSLLGERAGYLGISHAPRVIDQLRPEDTRAETIEHSGVSLVRYAGPHPASEIVFAEGRVLPHLAASELDSHLEAVCAESFPFADRWFVDWGLPFEALTERTLHLVTEVWCLGLGATDSNGLKRPSAAVSKWVDLTVVSEAEVEGSTESDRYSRGGRAMVFQPGVGAISGGVPYVLAEPYSRDAISIAEFVREQIDHEQ